MWGGRRKNPGVEHPSPQADTRSRSTARQRALTSSPQPGPQLTEQEGPAHCHQPLGPETNRLRGARGPLSGYWLAAVTAGILLLELSFLTYTMGSFFPLNKYVLSAYCVQETPLEIRLWARGEQLCLHVMGGLLQSRPSGGRSGTCAGGSRKEPCLGPWTGAGQSVGATGTISTEAHELQSRVWISFWMP